MDSIQITANKTPRYQDAHLELDFSRGLAALDAHRLVLTRKEYELLSLLVESAGEIVPSSVPQSSSILPPCAPTAQSAMDNPKPVPPSSRDLALSTR